MNTGKINNKTKILAGSLALIMCASLGAAVGTYALFTDQAKISNHLTGGDMNLTLKRSHLAYTYIDSQGVQQIGENTTVVDFSSPTSENVFGFTTTDKFVPTDYRVASMTISNSSSLAYNWYMSIKLTDTTASELAKQVLVEVDADGTEGYEKSAYLNVGLDIGSKDSPIGRIDKGGSKDFKIKISFPDTENNNAAQGLEANFDVIVNAVQYTAQ